MTLSANNTGSVVVSLTGNATLTIVFIGHISTIVVERTMQEVISLCEGIALESFLIDAMQVTGYAVEIRRSGVQLLTFLARLGAVHGACAAVSPSVRMIGSALAFVSPVRVKFYSNVHQAFASLDAGSAPSHFRTTR